MRTSRKTIISFEVFLLVVSSFAKVYTKSNLHWEYEGKFGTDHWADYFPKCGGSSQSPININQAETIPANDWEPLNFTDINVLKDLLLKNTGHSAKVDVSYLKELIPILTGGPLTCEYQLDQFHFHWGCTDAAGSEHYLDGRPFSGEVHLVHFKKEYGNVTEALKHEDGLAVVAAFLDASDCKENEIFEGLLEALPKVIKAGTRSTIKDIAVRFVLPWNLNEYFSYKGSLTTPQCDEVVTWIVLKHPLVFSSLQPFRMLENEKGEKVNRNYRPLQDLNGRKVYYYKMTEETCGEDKENII